jgi:hypothetical protein
MARQPGGDSLLNISRRASLTASSARDFDEETLALDGTLSSCVELITGKCLEILHAGKI